MDRELIRWILMPACVSIAFACATPVGIHDEPVEEVFRELSRSALSGPDPSIYTRRVLVLTGEQERFEDDPEATIDALRDRIRWEIPDGGLFALAELSVLCAERSGDRSHYLAAAAYAWAFLFPGDELEPPNPFDPRLRLASDLYNRAVAEGLWSPDTGRVELRDATLVLPEGSLAVDFDEENLSWGGHRLTDFQPATKLGVYGLKNRYRRSGIGAPMIASTEDAEVVGPPLLASIRVPVTALLRFQNAREGLRTGEPLRAHLVLFASDAASHVEIDDRAVPLEYETSSAFAATLSNDLIWDFETRGFFRGDFVPFDEVSAGEGLFLVYPYDPGKIPIVFVHGTASSPGRWADVVNELLNAPALRDHYQPWLFMYNTGQPIVYSGHLLRRALRDAVADLDPESGNPALRRMVVIGHSQGGLLTKLQVVSSGERFWKRVSDRPIDTLDLDPEARELLRDSLFFEPLPFVSRVIFLCTPHRGSFLASWRVSYWLRRFIRLPNRVVGAVDQLLTRNPGAAALRSLDELPSSLDNMTPRNPFLVTLADTPIAPGVHAHSIIAVKGDGPVEEGNDGVVKYTSAHLDGVESEKVVHSGHSAQSNPETLLEVGRILFEHLDEHPEKLLEVGPEDAAPSTEAP